MKNLLYALGIAGLGLVPINSYSQETSGYVKEEIIEKNFRKLDEGAKNLALTLVYTNPTSIKFDSLDQKTKNRLWNILANQYEFEKEQDENKLKEFETTKNKYSELQKSNENLVSNNKKCELENKDLKEKYEPVSEKRK
ncbi:MAG: hypothetical protein QT10_C0001G0157 [archaeon GW2011_AR19]|nr:MAG: hypothetical protein QT10_C0001G0157 [archaeon GW2011_AR19]